MAGRPEGSGQGLSRALRGPSTLRPLSRAQRRSVRTARRGLHEALGRRDSPQSSADRRGAGGCEDAVGIARLAARSGGAHRGAVTDCPISLNAIAKGYIVERACDVAMRSGKGVRGLVLNVGGDLRVCGELTRTVGIADPSPIRRPRHRSPPSRSATERSPPAASPSAGSGSRDDGTRTRSTPRPVSPWTGRLRRR